MDKQQQQQQRKPLTWYQLALSLGTPAQPEPEQCPACGSAEVYRWRRVRTCSQCFHMWEVEMVPKWNELSGEVKP